ncbi:hypothetical protein ABVT39_028057 [Epinephelus coioides]
MMYLYTREADELFLQGVTPHVRFSAKDWRHFRNKICKELSTSKGVYTAQWNGSVSGETYRVETDLEVYDPEAYIFFRQCMDNTVIHHARKGHHPYAWGDVSTDMDKNDFCTIWQRDENNSSGADDQQDDRNNSTFVDDFGKELGKRNLTFLTPQEKPTDTRQQPSSPDDCLGILDDKECDYFKCGHLEEIKQEIFNENYTVAQACVLFCLGNTPPSQQDIQDIAEDVLKEWTTSPFLTTRLKQVSSRNERLYSAVQKSMKIWSRNNGKRL